jgi:hypothetical protein
MFAALGTAVCLVAVQNIGVGWFSTISAIFLVVTTIGVYCTALWGESWRNRIDNRGSESVDVKAQESQQKDEEKSAA